jgi:hypothetical protein
MQELKQYTFKMPPSSLGNHMGRYERLAGVDYQIYPCVMLVEGVHQGVGSDPVYYSPGMLSESAPFWNNVPITVGHPVNIQGEHVLCNDDGTIRAQWQIGHISNVYFEDGKLKADLYINVREANRKAPELLPFLQKGGELQVSTGMLAGLDGTAGTWNGEDYVGAVKVIVPDHLALLPGGTGACSWSDGCGVRVNINEASHKTLQEENNMAQVEQEKCCPERVTALIENEVTPFNSDDLEWLEALNEDQIGKLETYVVLVADLSKEDEVVQEVVQEDVTLESILESAGEYKNMLNEALEARDEKRQTIIDKLLNHDGNKFTAEQLGEMETEMLTNMVGYIGKNEEKKPTYKGQSPNNDTVVKTPKVEPPELVTLTSHINKDKEEK